MIIFYFIIIILYYIYIIIIFISLSYGLSCNYEICFVINIFFLVIMRFLFVLFLQNSDFFLIIRSVSHTLHVVIISILDAWRLHLHIMRSHNFRLKLFWLWFFFSLLIPIQHLHCGECSVPVYIYFQTQETFWNMQRCSLKSET